MDLKFMGIGGAFNSQLGCNCAYVREDNKILFIDFGMDAFSKVIKYNLLENIEEIYVVITHTHGDHVGGLFTLVDYCYYVKNIVVRILNNSTTFTNKLVNLLNLTGIESSKFDIVEKFELNFNFELDFEKTTHTELLECYSLIFIEDGNKILYTSDSNDIENVKKKIDDESFTKIFCEVGENVPPHIWYNELKKLKSEKLVLMHISNMKLYNEIINDGYSVPDYLK